MSRLVASLLAILAASSALAPSALADEGMWTLNNFPRDKVKARLGVDIDDRWLEHQRLSAVRFNSGGSGSFVSATGLVLTNHHVGADCIAKLGKSSADLYRDGFYAARAPDELKCPDLELNVLLAIEDVTARVREAERAGAAEAERARARMERIASIEKECADRTKQRCDVVPLYRGGRYDLYRYKKYVDVRLVFAPEGAIAFFGGDPDNFTYPRYDLDMAIFRVYEAGKPIAPAHFLRWSAQGVREGDATFTVGHPGNTERLATTAMLETYRDLTYPTIMAEYERLRSALAAYAARGPEAERAARKTAFSVDNGRKAYGGYFAGLKEPALFERKAAQEATLKKAAAGKPIAATIDAAFTQIAAAERVKRDIYLRWWLLEGRPARALSELNPFNSRLFGIARALVRLREERQKPSSSRLHEMVDSSLPSLELQLFSPAPIDPAMEEAMLADALERLRARLGADDPAVRAALAGQKPADRARAVVRATKLADVATRRALAASPQALDAAHDPMIDLARAVDAPARAVRKRLEEEVDGPEEAALGVLARAQLELGGEVPPPDATQTLRISYGRVLGYKEGERTIPPITVYAGLYARAAKANDQPPWQLPARWREKKSKLRPTTPLNLVTTNDIIGGNSGSPLVDAKGELVGLIFDENIHGLGHIFGYRDDQGRAISVHALGMLDALRKVYDAGALADELVGAVRPGTN